MIEIHSKSNCPYCTAAKTYFVTHNLEYNELVYDDFEQRQAFYDSLDLHGGKRTMPQIFLTQAGIREYIGGYDDMIRSDLLARIQAENFDEHF